MDERNIDERLLDEDVEDEEEILPYSFHNDVSFFFQKRDTTWSIINVGVGFTTMGFHDFCWAYT